MMEMKQLLHVSTIIYYKERGKKSLFALLNICAKSSVCIPFLLKNE